MKHQSTQLQLHIIIMTPFTRKQMFTCGGMTHGEGMAPLEECCPTNGSC